MLLISLRNQIHSSKKFAKNSRGEKKEDVNSLWVVIDARLLIKEKKGTLILLLYGEMAYDKGAFYNLKKKIKWERRVLPNKASE